MRLSVNPFFIRFPLEDSLSVQISEVFSAHNSSNSESVDNFGRNILKIRFSSGQILAPLCAIIWGETFIENIARLSLAASNPFFSIPSWLYCTLVFISSPRRQLRSKRSDLIRDRRFFRNIPSLPHGKCRAQIYDGFRCRSFGQLGSAFYSSHQQIWKSETKTSSAILYRIRTFFPRCLVHRFRRKHEPQYHPLGDSLAVGAAFVWAIYSVVLKKLAVYKAPILVSTRTIFGYGLIFIFTALLVADELPSSVNMMKTEVWMNLVFLGFIACAACQHVDDGRGKNRTGQNRAIYLPRPGNLPCLLVFYSRRKSHRLVRQRNVPCAFRTGFVAIRLFWAQTKIKKGFRKPLGLRKQKRLPFTHSMQTKRTFLEIRSPGIGKRKKRPSVLKRC